MKKIVLSILSIATGLTLNAQTQIGNAGFENWENVSGGSEPVNWNSFLTASGGLNGNAANQLQNSTDVRPGSTGTHSVRLNSRSVLGVKANGVLTLGRVNMGSINASDLANHNYTVTGDANFSEAMTAFPDSIVFWVKFVPNGHNQNARMKATLHDNYNYQDPETTTSSQHVVATAVLDYPKTNNTWVRKAVPFNYSGPASSIQYLLVTFSTNATPGGGAADDYVWVDDVELIYNEPSFNVSNTTVCAGSSVNFTNTSVINSGVTSYSWSFPGGSPATSTSATPSVTYSTPGAYNATLTITNQYGSRTKTYNNYITVTALDNATFNYPNASYCSNSANPVPTAVIGGSYSSTTGLVFANSTTGEIDLAASTPGTYTVTHTTNGACPNTSTKQITIVAAENSTFNYPSNTICMTGGNQTPTVATNGGTFSSSPAGLTFVSTSTGEINVAGSSEGTYAIVYAVAGTCPSTTTVNVTLTSTPSADFNYAQASYCVNAVDPAPSYATGANAGVFSSTPAGLVINPNNGIIDLSLSDAGTYTIENNIAASGSCPSATHTSTITINDLPTVGLVLTPTTVCTYTTAYMLTGGTPTGGSYSGTGVGAGIFNPAAYPNGGTATVTYSYTDAATTCTNTAPATITIDACAGVEEVATFDAVTVYPNPTSGLIKVDNLVATTTYVVIATTGQVVSTGELNSTEATIDLSNVESGIYLLQLKQENDAKTIRIIKQ